MKQLLLFLINPCLPLAIYVIGCNTRNSIAIHNTIEATCNNNDSKKTLKKDTITYDSIKSTIKKEKKKLAEQYKYKEVAHYNEASALYIDLFENKLIPSWLGTTWDFNGTTKTPGKGTIACGYFVTTTLFDMGIDINVSKYAQCGSDIMVKHLIDKKNYVNWSNLSFDNFIKNLKTRKPFLAIVGLDFHTGYILYNGKQLYFIHSSYIQRRGVIKEIAAESGELKGSKWKSLGFITDDDKFMQNWLRQ